MNYVLFNCSAYNEVLAVPAKYARAVRMLMEGRNWLRLNEAQLVAQLDGAFYNSKAE